MHTTLLDSDEKLQGLQLTLGKMEVVLGQIDEAIVWVNMQGKIQWCNQPFDQLIGQHHIQNLGASLIDLLPLMTDAGQIPEQEHPVSLMLAKQVDQRKVYRYQGHSQKSTVEIFSRRFSVSKTEESIVLVIRNITARVETDKQLKESVVRLERKGAELERINQELDQFAYITSHDLKAPLRAIANLSQWIEEDLEASITPDTRKQMELLRGRVHHMEALIEGILQYSRVGRISVDIMDVDVATLLAEVIDTLAPPPGFKIEVSPGMPTLSTSRISLSQVFANLIGNAIKYHQRDDGHIQISVEDAGDFCQFCVTDDGPGIAEEYHEKVFAIFQTLQACDTVESTGIGLSLVKKIIEEQGGKIELASAAGEGASFCFSWPKQQQAADNEH